MNRPKSGILLNMKVITLRHVMFTKRLLCCLVLAALFFALPLQAQASCPLPVQQAYKAPNESAVYYVTEDCTKRPFTKPHIFFTYFTSWSGVQIRSDILTIPDDPLGFMPYGPLHTLNAGSLAKTVGDPRVYVILDGVKQWISSEEVFNALGYKWNWVEDVDPRLLDRFAGGGEITSTDRHPNFTLVKYKDDPRVYRLEPSPNDTSVQVAKYISNEEEFLRLGYRFDRIIELPGENPYGDVIDSATITDGTLSYGQLRLNSTFYTEGPLPLFEVEAYVVDCLDQMAETGKCSLKFSCFDEQDCSERKQQISSYIDQIEQASQQEIAQSGTLHNQAAKALLDQLVVSYQVLAGELTNKQPGTLAHIYPEQAADNIAHERTWRMVKTVLPERLWNRFETFHVFTDQQYTEIAYVTQIGASDDTWVIGFDMADTPVLVSGISRELAETIVHEAAHMITLDKDQMQENIVPLLFTDTVDDISRKRDIAYLTCQPNYYTNGACTKEDAYLNRFYHQFWVGVAVDEDALESVQAKGRYEAAPGDFVSVYAATNLEEDISESFTAFVFNSRPISPVNLSEEKIAFFYNYPELMSLREELRAGVATAGGENYLK